MPGVALVVDPVGQIQHHRPGVDVGPVGEALEAADLLGDVPELRLARGLDGRGRQREGGQRGEGIDQLIGLVRPGQVRAGEGGRRRRRGRWAWRRRPRGRRTGRRRWPWRRRLRWARRWGRGGRIGRPGRPARTEGAWRARRPCPGRAACRRAGRPRPNRPRSRPGCPPDAPAMPRPSVPIPGRPPDGPSGPPLGFSEHGRRGSEPPGSRAHGHRVSFLIRSRRSPARPCGSSSKTPPCCLHG